MARAIVVGSSSMNVQELAEELLCSLSIVVVGGAHVERQIDVLADEGVEAAMHHAARERPPSRGQVDRTP